MKRIALSCGMTVEVDPAVFDDMELMEEIAEVEENALLLPKVIRKVLGDEQKKLLYDCLRNEQGRVPLAAVEAAVVELFNGMGEPGKN